MESILKLEILYLNVRERRIIDLFNNLFSFSIFSSIKIELGTNLSIINVAMVILAEYVKSLVRNKS